jgi:hypothetical protein
MTPPEREVVLLQALTTGLKAPLPPLKTPLEAGRIAGGAKNRDKLYGEIFDQSIAWNGLFVQVFCEFSAD